MGESKTQLLLTAKHIIRRAENKRQTGRKMTPLKWDDINDFFPWQHNAKTISELGEKVMENMLQY